MCQMIVGVLCGGDGAQLERLEAPESKRKGPASLEGHFRQRGGKAKAGACGRWARSRNMLLRGQGGMGDIEGERQAWSLEGRRL